MTEAFLHFLFNSRKLGKSFQTTEGENLEIVEFGRLNQSSGPDFLEAQIFFDKKRWAGNIEFHLKSSDWNKHGHQNDKAYDNVIAHFVLEHDIEIFVNQFKLPVVELKGQINQSEFEKFQTFISNSKNIACKNQIHEVGSELIRDQIQLALRHRLDRKSNEIIDLSRENKGDQKKVELMLLARILGGKHNAYAFQRLIGMIDNSMLAHLNYDSIRLQALFHGLSGLLPENSSFAYVQNLISEFNYLKALFQLRPMSREEWHFFGMRPAGHPTFRIAQLVEVITSKQNSDQSVFWSEHYNFENRTKKRHDLSLSKEKQELIQVNVQLMLKYALAELRSNESVKKEVINELTQLNPEKNKIINDWKGLGIEAQNAADSQGLIEQKNEYCNRKKCLFCSIGRTLLNP